MRIESYLINLDKYRQKYDKSVSRLSEIQLVPKRFSAVYGKDLGEDYIRSITYPSVYYTMKYGRSIDSDIFSLGAIGCYMSHIELWKRLLEDPLNDAYLILEDDMKPAITDKAEISNFIEHSNNTVPDWDFLFLGWVKPGIPYLSFLFEEVSTDIPIDKYIYQINSITFCTHAYVINKKGAKRLLDSAFPIVDQVDSYISYMACRGDIKAYRTHKSMFLQQNDEGSSIQEGVFMNIKPGLNRLPPEAFKYFIILLVIMLVVFMIMILFMFYRALRR